MLSAEIITATKLLDELVLLKVEADSMTRPEITQICDVFRGAIIDVAPASLIIEATENENKIKLS